MTDIRMRRATAADALEVKRVFDNAVAAAWTHLGGLEREPLFGPQDWGDVVSAHLGPDVLLVAVDAGAIVGFCAVHPADGELYLLFVDPAHAGRGVGRALLRTGHEVLHAAGCLQAFLFTQTDNERAQAVYSAAGYRGDGQTRTSEFHGRIVQEVRMAVDLESVLWKQVGRAKAL